LIRRGLLAAFWISAMTMTPAFGVDLPSSARSVKAAQDVADTLKAMRSEVAATAKSAIYVRIFKTEGELEVWADTGTQYTLMRTYPICHFSGQLGPKLGEGDGQAPEGFYEVRPGQLNPNSRFHLAFNLGYPNAFDRAHQRTGDFLMVHGNCVSIGCYAMGDVAIEEIYTLVADALRAGQTAVPVHIFPFRFAPDWQAQHASSEWLDFWSQLEAGYEAFENGHRPPRVRVREARYTLQAQD